jgi:DNA replication protein DnaC
VLYHRVPRLFDALALARADGRHARLLKTIARVELFILDDWGLANVTAEQGRDLLEILDDRHGRYPPDARIVPHPHRHPGRNPVVELQL